MRLVTTVWRRGGRQLGSIRQAAACRNRGSPISDEAGPGQGSLEGSRAELMPETRDEQSRCQHACIALSSTGHRAEERQRPFRLLNAT